MHHVWVPKNGVQQLYVANRPVQPKWVFIYVPLNVMLRVRNDFLPI